MCVFVSAVCCGCVFVSAVCCGCVLVVCFARSVVFTASTVQTAWLISALVFQGFVTSHGVCRSVVVVRVYECCHGLRVSLSGFIGAACICFLCVYW